MVLVRPESRLRKARAAAFLSALGANSTGFRAGRWHQNFLTLAEALEVLGRVHGWPVLAQDQVDNGRTYVAAVRLRLDPAQLPTPFRVSAVTNREWTLASDWKRFPFTPLAPVQEAR